MTIEDLREIEPGRVIDTDLCIVGSGPAGLTIAGEFAGSAVSVLILESGGLQEETAVNVLNENRPCCLTPRRQQCCSGHYSLPARSPCAKSMVGRRSPRSSSLNALTGQPDPITSSPGDIAKPNFHIIRDSTWGGVLGRN